MGLQFYHGDYYTLQDQCSIKQLLKYLIAFTFLLFNNEMKTYLILAQIDINFQFINLMFINIQYLMKIKTKLAFLSLCVVLLCSVLAQDQADQTNSFEIISLGKPLSFKLEGNKKVGRYELSIDKNQVPKQQSKWYLFAMAQPKQKSKELFGSPTKIQIRVQDRLLKQCQIVQQSDSCFLKNNQFDYKKDKLQFSVHCDESCEFQFVTEIDYAYPLKLNKAFKLDFERSAYSKIFTLNVEGQKFHELRILLSPRGFIQYGEPVILLGNYGDQIPTQSQHDFKGMHTWDDGQGIFIRKTDLKEDKITLLVEGPQRNVLSLIAQGWQKQQRIEPIQYFPEFDYLKASQSRQIVIEIKQNITHRIKVVVFSGYIQTPQIFKLDDGLSGKTYPLQFSMPDQKYGQFQFRVSKQKIQKQRLKRILIKLTSRRQTTYIINYARQEAAISTILPYVSQSSVLQPMQTDQYFLKVQEVIQSSKQRKSSKIQIIVGRIEGNIQVTFYKCAVASKITSESIKNCQINLNNKGDFTQLQPIRHQNRGPEQRFWFEVSWDDYVKKVDKDKPQVVLQMVILVENKDSKKQSSYEIQYKNKDRIYLLKEGELVKDRVFVNQKRHYKLSVQDKDATQVRIHCTRISGEAFFIGSFEDPRIKKDHEKILPLYSIVTYKINPQRNVNQVFLQVQGVDHAYYSLTAQVIRKSQANPKKNGTTGYNQLIVRQEMPYQFLISPMESIVLQLHATSKRIHMNMKSSSAVKICMTQNLKSPPFSPNCEISNDFFIQMNQVVDMDKGLIGNIGIKNNNPNKNVTVKILISKVRNQSSGDEDVKNTTCELAAMNQVMFKRLFKNGKDSQGKSSHCVQFYLTKNEQVQLIVDLRGQNVYEYNKGQITASINGQEIINILNPTHKFSKQQIQRACSAKRQDKPDSFCYLRVKISGIQNTRARVLCQYTDQAIRLMDGIAHPVHSTMLKSQSKHFYAGIHNMQDITIFLQNKVGEYKLYASLMPFSQFTQQGSSVSYPTKQTKDFQSSNPFYYLEQIVIISSKNISDKCPSDGSVGPFGRKWINCVLLVSVYLDSSAQIQKNGKFVIEATQQNRQLIQTIPTSGYLQKKSTAFYHYQNKLNGTILVSISNQNKNCVDVYMREGSQRATAQYNQKHAKGSNSLIFNDAKIGTYSITLQATQNCPFSIVATSGANNISKIKKGSFQDIDLKLSQTKYFLFENLISQTFKVLSLHKTGEVLISVKPIDRESLDKIFSNDLKVLSSWSWSGKDSVRIQKQNGKRNTTNPDYCVDCFYLIKIEALRPTQASIVIPTPGSQLPITTNSIIRDILVQKQTTTYRVFTQSKSQIEVYVQYGRIQVQIIQSDKDKVSFNKTFEASKAPLLQNFTLSKTQDFEFLRYVRVNITASKDSYFSFGIVTDPDPQKRSGSLVKHGIPEYIFVDVNKQKCLYGNMIGKDMFLMNFPKASRYAVDTLQVVLKINNKSVIISKQIGNTQMLVRINQTIADKNQNKKFQICMKGLQAVSITFIQSSPLTYWPQKQTILVVQSANLTFGSQGKGIIQINQCQSRASITMFSQFNDIDQKSSEIKQRRRSNNIIQFYHYGAAYVRIIGKKATARWIPVNESSGAGTGYDIYKASSLRITKIQGNQLLLTAQPLKVIDQKLVKGTVQSLKYQFYAAKEQMQLYGAYNCKQGVFKHNYVKVNIDANIKDNKFEKVRAFFNIDPLKQKFGVYKYFLMGVKATMVIKFEDSTQQYRFYYPYQQVARQLLYSSSQGGLNPTPQNQKQQVQNQQQPNQNKGNMLEYVGYALLSLVIIGVLFFICKKVIKKCYSRKRIGENSSQLGKEMKYYDLTEQNH